MKLKKVVYILISAYIGLLGVFISGCKEKGNENQELPNKPKNCEVIIETTLYGRTDYCNDFISICNSLDDLKEVCVKNGFDFFDGDNQKNNFYNTNAGEIIRGYTEEHFKNKAFVVCAFYKSSWAGQYRIAEIEIVSGKLTLYVKYPRNDDANEVLNNIFLIAATDKSLVSNITDMECIFN